MQLNAFLQRLPVLAPEELPRPEQLIGAGCLVVINHSGGKDSCALHDYLVARVPTAQLVVVHSTLGESEWPGALEQAQADARRDGLPFLLVTPRRSFLQMVARRFTQRPDAPPFPSAKYRQCTSTLKTEPITSAVKKYADQHGFTVVLNCMGLRAQESCHREKKAVFSRNKKATAHKRPYYDYLPIHKWSEHQVWASRGQTQLSLLHRQALWRQGQRAQALAGWPFHWAYVAGNKRLSCIFCFMADKLDLLIGAVENPQVYAAYVAQEQRTGYALHISCKPLPELTGLSVEQAFALHAQGRGALATAAFPAPTLLPMLC